MSFDVGTAVKARRARLGLTLEVLARGSGVSRAMLSDVERGQRSPTLKILSQIAMGLGCRVTDLLSEAPGHELHVELADQHPLVLDEGSGVARRSLPSPLLRAGLELVRYELPVGAAIERGPEAVRYTSPAGATSGVYPPNPRGSVEHLTVEAGSVSFDDAERRLTLQPGDSVSYRLLLVVRLVNEGDVPARLALLLDTLPSVAI